MQTKKIIYASFLIALGVLLPIIFHIIPGNIGPFILPIHYSAFLAGGFFGPIIGALVGLITPLLSYLLTGMPPNPNFLFITFETLTYGLVFGFLFYHRKINVYLSLVIAMILGRVVNIIGNFIVAIVLFKYIPQPFIIINVLNNLSLGLIGAIMQLIIIPIIVERINIVFQFNKIIKEEDNV